MKRLVALLTVACLLLSSVGVVSAAVTQTNSSVAQGNYLKNGTVEDTATHSAWGSALATTNAAHSGVYSLAGNGGQKRTKQAVTVPTGKTYIQSAYVRTQDTITTPDNSHYIGFYNEGAIAGIQGKLYGPTHNWTQILWMYEVPASLGAEATINTGIFSNSPHFYVDDLYLGQVTAVLSDIQGETLIYIPETGSVTETYQTSYTNQVGTMDGLSNASFAWSLDKSYTGISIDAQSGVLTVSDAATTQTVNVIATVTPNINDLAPITKTKTVTVKPYTPIKELYVRSGATGGDGSFERPYGSLNEARAAVRNINKNEYDGITVYLRGGEYRFSSPVDFTNNDSGTATCPITYKNYRDEEVYFLGSKPITGQLFTTLASGSAANRIPSTVRNKILQLDLSAAGLSVSDYGELAYPGMRQYRTLAPSTDLFLDGEAMTLARYPNTGYMDVETVVNAGSTPSSGGAWNSSGAFTLGYSAEHAAHMDTWTTATDAKMYGYFFYSWSDETIDLASVNASNNTITSALPSYYGVRSGEGQRFYVYNLLEELDTPGEYYIDRTTNTLYFYPPEGVDVTKKTLNLSTMTGGFLVLTNAKYINFSGIKFSQARGRGVTITSSSGDYSRNNTVTDCTFTYLGGNNGSAGGLAYGYNNGFERCTFEHIDGGVELSGGDLATLTHGNNYVRNCYFNDFSRRKKTYNPAILMRSMGQIAANNVIENGPHTAIMFDGPENIVEYNRISNVLLESTDAGAIYCGSSVIARGNQIRYNYISDIIDPIYDAPDQKWCHGIYLDDEFCSADIYGNILKDIEGFGVFINGGRDNTVDNNVFYNCERATIHITKAGIYETGEGEKFSAGGSFINQLNDPTIDNALWRKEYPEVFTMRDEFGNGTIEVSYPKNNVISDNVYIASGPEYFLDLAIQYGTFLRNKTYAENPGFASVDDFTLLPGSQLKADNNQFTDIPFAMIGNHFEILDLFIDSVRTQRPGNSFTKDGKVVLDIAQNNTYFEDYYTLKVTEKFGSGERSRLLTEKELDHNVTWIYPDILLTTNNRLAKSPVGNGDGTRVCLRTIQIQSGGVMMVVYNRNDGAIVRDFELSAMYIPSTGGKTLTKDFDFSVILRSFTPTLSSGSTELSPEDSLTAGTWTPQMRISNMDSYFRGFYGAALYEKQAGGLLKLLDIALAEEGLPVNEKTITDVSFGDKTFTVSDPDKNVIKMFVWDFVGSTWSSSQMPLIDSITFAKK